MRRFQHILIAALTLGSVAHATTISVSPSTNNQTVGDIFNVDVRVDNIVDLFAWEFDFGYDPLIVSVSLVSNGTFLSAGGAETFDGGTIDNSFGSVSAVNSSLNSAVAGVSGSGVLATITLHALAAGQSNLAIFNVILLDSTFADIPATATSAAVTVSAATTTSTPEPGTAVLMLVASTLCAWRRLRRPTASRRGDTLRP